MGNGTGEPVGEPISTWARWVMGGAGTAMTFVGTVAVFVPSTNVAGVPLLIVAGAGFMYAALAGQPLLSLSKDGFTFARVQSLKRGAEAVVNDPEVPAEVRDRIVEAFEDNGVAISQSLTEQEIEREARKSLSALGEENGFKVSSAQSSHDSAVDMVLSNPSGLTVGVEVRVRLRLRGWAASMRKLRQIDAAHRILVVDSAIPSELAQVMEAEGISAVAFGPSFDEEVIRILRRINFIH